MRSPDPDGAPRFTQELLARFIAGEKQAFDRVFAELRRDMFLVVQRFFRSPFDQEEAFQEVWLQLHRARSQLDVNRHQEFVGWARRVARNRCIDLLKARQRRPEVPVEDVEPAGDAGQLEAVVGAKLQQALASFVERLDAEQQRFFQLCFREELSHEEIAAELSISVRRSKYLKKKLLERMVKNPGLRRLVGGEAEKR
jgi:RNA polymerase sigma-70 factor (ECF subfamily)